MTTSTVYAIRFCEGIIYMFQLFSLVKCIFTFPILALALLMSSLYSNSALEQETYRERGKLRLECFRVALAILVFTSETEIVIFTLKVYLFSSAPTDCLQYFTETSGTVRSFNWKDISGVVRQLANQDYNVCFRTEMAFNGQVMTFNLS